MRFLVAVFLTAPLFAQSPRTLTLAEAEALAVQQHPQLAGAHFSTEAAAQVVREVRSPLYPQLSAAATAVGTLDNSRLAAGFLNAGSLLDRVAGGLALQQLVSDFGRTRHLVDSSKLQQQSHVQGEAATRAAILLNVDRAYFRALRAQAVVRVADETQAERQLIVDQVTALMQSNLKSQLDVSFASVNLADARLLVATARSEVQEAFADLSNALGLADTQTFTLMEGPPEVPPEPEVAPLIRQALTDRPDLMGLRFDRDAARENAAAERALTRPTVSVAAAVGGVPAHTSALGGRYGAAGINISIPVFNGSLFSARHSEAEFRAQAAAERIRDAESQTAKDVSVAWLEAGNAYQRIALTDQLLAQANLALDLAQSRYELGLSSIVELSQAQLAKTSAEIQNLTSHYDFQLQNSVLRYQMGALK
jgi:outer membrane protein